jgi:hypothetical protein
VAVGFSPPCEPTDEDLEGVTEREVRKRFIDDPNY